MDPYIIWSVLCVRMLFLIIISSVGAYWSVREVWNFLGFRITAHDSGAHLYAFRWVSCLANQNAIRSIDYNCVCVFLSENIVTKPLFKCSNTKSTIFIRFFRHLINISPRKEQNSVGYCFECRFNDFCFVCVIVSHRAPVIRYWTKVSWIYCMHAYTHTFQYSST